MTLAKEFQLLLKKICLSPKRKGEEIKFLKKYAVTDYSICCSSESCEWVSSSVIFLDGSVYGSSAPTVRKNGIFGEELKRAYEYQESFTTFYYR